LLAQTQPRRMKTGQLDGGYLTGPGDEARDADVMLEDWVGRPNYSERPTAYDDLG